MRNLETYGNECIKELHSFGFNLSHLPEIIWKASNSINDIGICKHYVEKNKAIISITKLLLYEDVVKNDNYLKEVIFHELLHALTPYDHHGSTWSKMAKYVNEKSDGKYLIETEGSYKRYGVPDTIINKKVRYIAKCDNCGIFLFCPKNSKIVRHPKKYKCACGGNMLIKKLI